LVNGALGPPASGSLDLYRIALGAGQKVLSLQTVPTQCSLPWGSVPASTASASMAGSACAAHQRKKLEDLCRYLICPAIANERLSLNRAGQVVLTLKTPYRDGTTHIVMSPLEFMQRLAALA
jgi:putative transposase